LAPVEPMAVDFPFARSILIVEAHRTENKSARTSTETRYYLSSLEGEEHTPPQWLELVRGHWAGVATVTIGGAMPVWAKIGPVPATPMC
jgi:hypothetical protein